MGFMAITTEVNVDLLNKCFELRPFHGLRKQHTDDVLEPPVLSHHEEKQEHFKAFQDTSIPITEQKLSVVATEAIDA